MSFASSDQKFLPQVIKIIDTYCNHNLGIQLILYHVMSHQDHVRHEMRDNFSVVLP